MARSTIEQWRMFKAVADFGGFQQAADHIHKSQSTVHHAVSKLEDVLGVTLIEVQGRKTRLTQVGEQLLRRVNYLLAEAERFENVAQNLKQGVESRLTVAVDEAFPKDVLYQSLVAVSDEFPLVHMEVIETILTGANELLNKGMADIAISPFTLANELSEDICRINFIAVCGAEHPLAHKSKVSPQDLKHHRQIVLRDSGVDSKTDVGWLGSEQRWTVTHLATSIELIQNNLGFAWLPQRSIAEHLQYGQLVPIQLQRGATRSNNFYLNFRDAEVLGPVARSFIGHVRYRTTDE